MKLTRNDFNKKQYYYLNEKDSTRYDELKDSKDPKDIEICKLILDKAKSSRSAHQTSSY
jgi:hypothetical protein